jgi:AcrR family transcriptional regulator
MSVRKPAEDRREEILEAACAAILQNGLEAWTTRDVTGRLGLSVGILFHYFPSARALRAAAFLRIAERDLASAFAMEQGLSAAETLRRFLADVLTDATDDTWRTWFDAWTVARDDPAIADACRAQMLAWQARVTALLARGVAEGDMRTADAEGAARRMVALIDGLAGQMLPPFSRVTPEEATADLFAFAAAEGLLPADQAFGAQAPGGL